MTTRLLQKPGTLPERMTVDELIRTLNRSTIKVRAEDILPGTFPDGAFLFDPTLTVGDDSTVIINSEAGTSTRAPIITFNTAATLRALIGVAQAGGDLLAGVAALDMIYRSNAPQWWTVDGGSTSAMKLDATGLTITNDIVAAGGFRQTIDGFNVDNIAASVTNQEIVRAVGRFRAVRPGSVTGVVVTSTEARTANTCTVDVYKNTGLAGAAGSSIGLTAVLDGTNTSRKATTQAKDADTFAAGDELYIVYTTSAGWTPTTADLRCALEVET